LGIEDTVMKNYGKCGTFKGPEWRKTTVMLKAFLFQTVLIRNASYKECPE
jgi:hypothetical protein